ncbi:hypothetical protein CH339_02645 [Rhodobium orientis]|uniref:Uncharacterized protein n=2 Tax=Rhodobium orientis TaxID=34017 RepID=A0A327JVK7_9HYPH|nr:hypothetical protein [Rhodobium orientis]RAI29564.1 hypothetical protein CH339_02645 [Rhodobium orientis]
MPAFSSESPVHVLARGERRRGARASDLARLALIALVFAAFFAGPAAYVSMAEKGKAPKTFAEAQTAVCQTAQSQCGDVVGSIKKP